MYSKTFNVVFSIVTTLAVLVVIIDTKIINEQFTLEKNKFSNAEVKVVKSVDNI